MLVRRRRPAKGSLRLALAVHALQRAMPRCAIVPPFVGGHVAWLSGTVMLQACGPRESPAPDKTGWTSQPVIVCAPGETEEGVDVSEFQGVIDWTLVRASGRTFALSRVSDGAGHIDPTFVSNWSGIRAAGMARGAYQFFRASEDAVAQATVLVNAVGALDEGDLPPVADVELTDGAPTSDLVDKLATWVDAVQAGTGRMPMIYAPPAFWKALPGTGRFSDVDLWIANWAVPCPDTPPPWKTWSFWQYSDQGTVAGVEGPVDLDRSNGHPLPGIVDGSGCEGG
jgi:lysozyme